MKRFARRWGLRSLCACGLAAAFPACHEKVSLGGWSDVPGTSTTSGFGGATATVDTVTTTASVVTTSSGTNGGATTGTVGASGAAGDTGQPPDLPACLTPGIPGPLNPAGPGAGLWTEVATETATDWTWPMPLASLEWDLMVEHEIVRPTPSSEATTGYYYSHQFSFLEGIAGILGIQAEGGYSETSDPPEEFTKIAVFWLSGPPLAAELGDIAFPDARVGRQEANGLNYLTIHARFDWQICTTYRFRLAQHSTEPDGTVWYGAWIEDVNAGVRTFLGRMLLPANSGPLAPLSISRTQGIDFFNGCEFPAHASVLLGTPTADDGAVVPMDWSNRFGVPLSCPSSRFTQLEGAIRHEQGVPP